MKRQRRGRVFGFWLVALVMGLCSVTACPSAVKDFHDPLLVPRCDGGAGGQTISQGGSMTVSSSGGSGGSAGVEGECAAP